MKTTAVNLRGSTLWQASLLRGRINLLFDLTKIKISLLVTFSTAAGYLLATGKITIQMLAPTTAVFLLACGACALNQYQEREIDRWMERTKSRPIPSGRLNPEAALWISLSLIFLGALTLFFRAAAPALGLGLFAVLWYNLVYTPLKQKTAFAAVPGALVGMIPPVLGWVAGGGEVLDARIAGVALFFFMWQIPHFWLLLLEASEDYGKVGLPSITKIFSTEQTKGIIFVWLLSAGVTSLIIPFLGFLSPLIFRVLLVAAASWIFWSAVIFLRSHENEDLFRATFIKLNIYAVLVISLLSVERLLSSLL